MKLLGVFSAGWADGVCLYNPHSRDGNRFGAALDTESARKSVGGCWVGLVMVLFSCAAFSQDKPAYQLYEQSGNTVSYDTMLLQLRQADVVLFGELHNDALSHWLELQVAQDLWKPDSNLVLGLEMLEADDQLVLNEYLAGTIEERNFTGEIKLWDNYMTDYRPLVNFAQQHQIPVVATNIPRRYASLVARAGLSALDSLSASAQAFIAPLPVEVDTTLPGYKNMLEMMGGGSGHGAMSGENMVNAQAIKDATMAHFILENLPDRGVFLHLNGSYHSDHFEGIYWYLKKAQPDLEVLTISSVSQEDIMKLEEGAQGVANFVFAIPNDMTKTY